MQTTKLDYSLPYKNIINNDISVLTKLFLLKNPKLVLLLIRRLIIILVQKITQQKLLLEEISSRIEDINKEDTKIDNGKLTALKIALLELSYNTKEAYTKYNNAINNFLNDFKELKKGKSTEFGLSNIDVKEDLFIILNLYSTLEITITTIINNINNSINNWLTSKLDEQIYKYLKENSISKIETLIENINDVSKITIALDLFASRSLLSNLTLENPLNYLNTSNLTISSVNNIAKTFSINTVSNNTLFSITIGNTTTQLNYPSTNAYNRAWLLAEPSTYNIPTNSSLYVEFNMKPGKAKIKPSHLPANVAELQLISGQQTLDAVIARLNNDLNLLNENNVPTIFGYAEKFANNSILLYGNPDVDYMRIITKVNGILNVTYTPPYYSAHQELGFREGQLKEFRLTDLNRLLATVFNSSYSLGIITITANENIKINNGIASDLGFTDATANSSYLSIEGGTIDLQIGDEIYIDTDKIIINEILDNKIYYAYDKNITKKSFKARQKNAIEIEKLLNTIKAININSEKFKELLALIVNEPSILNIKNFKVELSNQLNLLNSILSSIMIWNPTEKDLTLLNKLFSMLEEKNASYLITKLNNCQFNELEENTYGEKVLKEIELVGRGIVTTN